ncbi:MAG: hypothetical protein O3C10_03175 [Chloroflexi bacterium]|nr:hypothetical protein [Chloroflexota bacterium]
MIGLLHRLYGYRRRFNQRGITGTETAIVIMAGAAVFATMAVTFYASVSSGSDDAVYAELQEAVSGLEPRGGVVGFTGAGPDGDAVVYKLGFVVASAPGAEPVDLGSNYRTDATGIDPDTAVGTSGLTVRYLAGGEVIENVPWTVNFLGYSDGDSFLELDEKAQVSVWLLDRDHQIDIDDPGAVVPRDNGTATLNPLRSGDEFVIELGSLEDNVLRISRVIPAELTPVLDLK